VSEPKHLMARASVILPVAGGIADAAERMIAWDGRGELPDLDIRSWVEHFGGRVYDDTEWQARVADDYERTLRNLPEEPPEAEDAPGGDAVRLH
jgi:hypothetical protein